MGWMTYPGNMWKYRGQRLPWHGGRVLHGPVAPWSQSTRERAGRYPSDRSLHEPLRLRPSLLGGRPPTLDPPPNSGRELSATQLGCVKRARTGTSLRFPLPNEGREETRKEGPAHP